MRSFSLSFVSIAVAVGCGGSIAHDASDASTDSAIVTDAPPGFDTSVSDSIGPPTDVGPLPDTPTPDSGSCPLLSDPCFAQFAKEASIAESCMGHPDTCAASGNTDASGCGLRTSSGGTDTCSWPDGARTETTRTSGFATNASGATCYKLTIALGGGGAKATIYFPDGKTFTETVSSSGGGSIVVGCPDGSSSRPFTNTDTLACKLGVTCCSPNTPPTCG